MDHAVELKYVSPSSDRRVLEMHGRLVENTRRLLDFDRETMTYALVDEAAEESAQVSSDLDGIPRRGEDADGVSERDLATLWGLKDPKRKLDRYLKSRHIERSDELVKVGPRAKEWRYWRADIVVQPGASEGQ